MADDSYDFRLTVDGTEIGLMLADDPDTGQKIWGEGFAPDLAQQFTTDSFSYEHVPQQLEIAMPFENWHKGAGFINAGTGVDHTGHNTHKYNYSRGIDFSWEDTAYISPAKQTPTTDVAAAPVQFFHSSLGYFCVAGQYIYEYNTVSDAWTQRDDATADAVDYTASMVELDGVLYVGRGDGAAYKYSSNGSTWVASNRSGDDALADYFVVRGTGAQAVLWKILGTAIQNTPDGVNSATSWSGSDTVGSTSDTTTGMIVADDDIYVFKQEGFYRYTGSTTTDVWATEYIGTNNGKNPYRWVDGNIYVPYGDRLLQYNPIDNSISLIWPIAGHTGTEGETSESNPETTGTFSDVTGDNEWLYFPIKNGDGNTYIMKFSPVRDAAHTWVYLGANDCNAIDVAGPGAGHTVNPVVFIGHGSTSRYFILPRIGYDPKTDSNYRFDIATDNTAYGPWVTFGAQAFNKFLNRGSVIGENLSGAKNVILKYMKDNDTVPTVVLTGSTDGKTQEAINDTVEFNRIRYVLTMITGDSRSSPRLLGGTLHATPNPPRLRKWSPRVMVADGLPLRDTLAKDPQSGATLRRYLYLAPNKRCQMQDRIGNTYVVRVLDVQSAGLIPSKLGGVVRDVEHIDMLLYEITQLTFAGLGSTAIYGVSTYGSGVTYG
jgi:hypothetical protein